MTRESELAAAIDHMDLSAVTGGLDAIGRGDVDADALWNAILSNGLVAAILAALPPEWCGHSEAVIAFVKAIEEGAPVHVSGDSEAYMLGFNEGHTQGYDEGVEAVIAVLPEDWRGWARLRLVSAAPPVDELRGDALDRYIVDVLGGDGDPERPVPEPHAAALDAGSAERGSEDVG